MQCLTHISLYHSHLCAGIPAPSTTGVQHPKLTPPAIAVATTEQLQAKVRTKMPRKHHLALRTFEFHPIVIDLSSPPSPSPSLPQEAYAAKLKQALPEKLSSQAADIIAQAKSSLGLGADANAPGTAAVEAAITKVLSENKKRHPRTLPPLPTLPRITSDHPHQQPSQHQQHPPQRTSRRMAQKRAREVVDTETDPAALPPSKRVQRMEALYDQLRELNDYQSMMVRSLREAKAELAAAKEENDNLWAATAHIGAAMHAAIEERDSCATVVPVLGGEEEDDHDMHHHNHNSNENRFSAALLHTSSQQQQEHNLVVGDGLVPMVNASGNNNHNHNGGGAGGGGLPFSLAPNSMGRDHPLLTPGTAHLASLFSPMGDVLEDAMNMFGATPAVVAMGGGRMLLFKENMTTTMMHDAVDIGGAGAKDEEKQQGGDQEKDCNRAGAAEPATQSTEKSFSFKL